MNAMAGCKLCHNRGQGFWRNPQLFRKNISPKFISKFLGPSIKKPRVHCRLRCPTMIGRRKIMSNQWHLLPACNLVQGRGCLGTASALEVFEYDNSHSASLRRRQNRCISASNRRHPGLKEKKGQAHHQEPRGPGDRPVNSHCSVTSRINCHVPTTPLVALALWLFFRQVLLPDPCTVDVKQFDIGIRTDCRLDLPHVANADYL
jgi:hypothetical protein